MLEQPEAGGAPLAFNGGWGDAEDFGGLFGRQTHEVTEFDQFSLLRLERGELFQCLIDLTLRPEVGV